MRKIDKTMLIFLIGILTLIIAIAGATFAFFSVVVDEATGDKITGTTASMDLDLSIVSKSAGFDNPLIPQKTDAIASAVVGTSNGSCVDDNGNTVCQVYEIVIKNLGSDAVNITGSLVLNASTISDLKWGLGTSATEGFSPNKIYEKTENDLINPDTAGMQTITLQPNDGVNNSGLDMKKFYIVIYIEETGENQTSTNTGSFQGTVTFSASGGSGVSATFSS